MLYPIARLSIPPTGHVPRSASRQPFTVCFRQMPGQAPTPLILPRTRGQRQRMTRDKVQSALLQALFPIHLQYAFASARQQTGTGE
ncbi:hypothetical protein E2C01_060073 [Portunus trituberculatus]|uniref:Uncharacterized protein n=1 Tax=Portunus trituberculatus TaxID=210409 RepID=A0A5B7H8B5_PORTR|nr:hypothetical protein [Portunus trituberculatus]